MFRRGERFRILNNLITYLEQLKLTEGRLAGQTMTVMPWQKRFVRGSFAPGVGESALSIARGCGKSTLVSGLAAAALDGPLVEPRGQCLVIAASFMQGIIIARHIQNFLADSLEADKLLPAPARRWRVWDTAQQFSITDKNTGASVRVLGSDPRKAHGLAPTLTLCDEPSQWEDTSSERMLAALRTAAGKQPRSLMILLGTRPASPEHWYEKLLNGGADYSQVHSAGIDDPTGQRRTWIKANPSLSIMPDLEQAIRRESKLAKQDESVMASFRALRLNQGISDTAQSTLLDAQTWRDIEGDVASAGPCYWGLDLGTNASMSAVTAYWPESGRLESVAAFPTEPNLHSRGLQDGVGTLYVQGWKRAELIMTGGLAVDVTELIEEARSRFGTPRAIAADRWREAELRDCLRAVGLRRVAVDLRGQGFKDGAEDVRAFRRACLEGRVKPVKSLILASAIAQARVVTDPSGNQKLSKKSEGGRKLRARDDAAAAAILGVSLAERQPKRSSGVYHGMV